MSDNSLFGLVARKPDFMKLHLLSNVFTEEFS